MNKVFKDCKWAIVVLIFTFLMMLSTFYCFACTGDDCKQDSQVFDSNDGKVGQVLTYCGEKGNNSIGTWADPSFLKGEKGDKGDTGAPGVAGQNGTNGQDGYTPVKNVDYFDGKDGLNGQDGAKGDTGANGKDVDPAMVESLQNINTDQNEQIRNSNSKIKALEKTQYVVEANARIYDTKRLTLLPFVRYNIGRDKVDTVGLRFVVKFGSSYEEKKLAQLEARLKALEVK